MPDQPKLAALFDALARNCKAGGEVDDPPEALPCDSDACPAPACVEDRRNLRFLGTTGRWPLDHDGTDEAFP